MGRAFRKRNAKRATERTRGQITVLIPTRLRARRGAPLADFQIRCPVDERDCVPL